MRILRYTTTNSFNGKSYLCTTGKLRFQRTKVSPFNVKKLYWILRFIAAILSVLMFSYFQSIKQKTAFKMNLRYLQYGKLNISKGVFLKFISSLRIITLIKKRRNNKTLYHIRIYSIIIHHVTQ